MASKTGRELLKDARLRAKALEPEEVHGIVEASGGRPPVLLDVREGDEWRAGHLPGAVHLPRATSSCRSTRSCPTRTPR